MTRAARACLLAFVAAVAALALIAIPPAWASFTPSTGAAAPVASGTVQAPSTVAFGSCAHVSGRVYTVPISWPASTSRTITSYTVTMNVNGGTYSTLYTGQALSTTATVNKSDTEIVKISAADGTWTSGTTTSSPFSGC